MCLSTNKADDEVTYTNDICFFLDALSIFAESCFYVDLFVSFCSMFPTCFLQHVAHLKSELKILKFDIAAAGYEVTIYN